MDHFYITLPSNSSEDVYGKQPMSSYKTYLAKQLDLNVDEWEVGLAELIYPHTWFNLIDATFSIKIQEDNEWGWLDLRVPDALYETPQDLMQAITDAVNQAMPTSLRGRILFIYNELLRKLTAFISPGYMVRFGKSLSIALGLGDDVTTLKCSRDKGHHGTVRMPERIVYDNDKIVADFVMDLDRGLHTFFIYSDIVESQLVGDSHVPLLRTIAVTGRNGEVVSHSFDNIHYVALSRSTFQELLIHISDDTGRRVPFQYGRVIVKLHFRRK